MPSATFRRIWRGGSALPVAWTAPTLAALIATVPGCTTSPPSISPPDSALGSGRDSAAEVTYQVRYYEVSGRTAQAIRASLDQERQTAIELEDGAAAQHDGRTDWYVTWRWTSTVSDAGCTVTEATVQVDVGYIMPKLAGPRVSRGVAADWRRYMRALWTHEEGHATVALNAGDAVHHALITQPPQPTCDELDDIAARAATAALEASQAAERAYDRDTQHGLTQGAVFP